MRILAIGLAALALSAGASAQDGDGHGRRVKCWVKGVPQPWEGYNKGVKFTVPYDDAVALAKREKKPLLVFHLVGDADKHGTWAAGHVMRTVTFSDKEVAKAVNDGFVATWVNKNRHFHSCELDTEVSIARDKGEGFATRNFAVFFATPDGRVLNYAVGYLAPKWFLPEATLALDVWRAENAADAAKLHAAHRKEHASQDRELGKQKPRAGRTADTIAALREALSAVCTAHARLEKKGALTLKAAMADYGAGNQWMPITEQ